MWTLILFSAIIMTEFIKAEKSTKISGEMMKRKTAKEILTASFRELAATKSIDKITIKDIVDHCGYPPATFYRNFKDKYDLIAREHTRSVAEITEQDACVIERIISKAGGQLTSRLLFTCRSCISQRAVI